MAQEERYGRRDLVYSAWHRRASTRRFVSWEKATLLAMIDLDASLYVEYDDRTKEPLALIETARDVGQSWKPTTVTRRLAVRAGLPAFIVLYTEASVPNPADPIWHDILSFRVRQIAPMQSWRWETFTPAGWCQYLTGLREASCQPLDAAFRAQT